MSPATVWAVVPAAGRGSRFGGEVPKQYLELAGAPVLLHALRPFVSHPEVQQVALVLPAGDAEIALEAVESTQQLIVRERQRNHCAAAGPPVDPGLPSPAPTTSAPAALATSAIVIVRGKCGT